MDLKDLLKNVNSLQDLEKLTAELRKLQETVEDLKLDNVNLNLDKVFEGVPVSEYVSLKQKQVLGVDISYKEFQETADKAGEYQKNVSDPPVNEESCPLDLPYNTLEEFADHIANDLELPDNKKEEFIQGIVRAVEVLKDNSGVSKFIDKVNGRFIEGNLKVKNNEIIVSIGEYVYKFTECKEESETVDYYN